MEGDDIGTALIAHYNYAEYIDHFEEIYNLLSKDAVLSGAFERNFGDIHGAIRREPFDEYFLRQIQTWRNELGEDVLRNNENVDVETLNIYVQRILNRIIFLRICEDREFENYESLKEITTYEELKQLFVASDRKYDSGLFEMLDEDHLSISDDLIIEIFQSLYYPNNSYEFGVIEPYIIGQIYELFLAESLEINDNGQIFTVLKPEVVDSQGVVNTPKNIADIIVEETLSPLYANKAPDEIQNYRIADICCGSGNFLLSAFEFTINYYIEYFRGHDCDAAIQRGDIYQNVGSTNYSLSFELKRQILQNMIYGVDIDPLAIEVAKFSLMIKLLENTSGNELNAYQHRTHNQVLPNLEDNIKLGNSLVDTSYINFDHTVYVNHDLMNKLKMFNWDAEFGNRKFDAIVGNPPYIRVQNMVHYSPEEYHFYKSDMSGFRTSKTETLDKYYLFIEKGLSLLNDDGMLGYIVPHKFMNIKSGAELRDLLSSNFNVKRIYHFGTQQVFKNRSTYTCILILSKRPCNEFDIGYVQDLQRFVYEHASECQTYPSPYLSRQPWSFLPNYVTEQLEAMRDKCVPLSSVADIFVGVQTSADDIYIIHSENEDEQFIYGHDCTGEPFQIEKAILRKSVYDAQLTCYEKIVANSFIIFPYKQVNNRPVLYSIEEMEADFPHTLEYLYRHKEKLDRRSMQGRTENNWYAFGRSQSLKRFLSGEHLVWPVLSLGANYVFDDEMVVFTGGGNGPFYGLEMKSGGQMSIFYIQAILNHWLMELLVKSKASTFRGDYYSHGKQFIATLPVYNIDFENAEECRIHDTIVQQVLLQMQLKSQLTAVPNNAQRIVLERAVNTAQQELQSLLDDLYGIQEPENEELQ
ncbi:MAG: Eco57I restriction-modification methylase domain-containing protein [Clostridiales bacterium]|nr:Eco57I restriction-modification methylase domain-containing protein [Clostridiales bacterium]